MKKRMLEMLFVYGGMFLSRFSTLGASVIAARVMGVEEFGEFTLFVTIALLVADMGRPIDNAFVREVAGSSDIEAAPYFQYVINIKLVIIGVAVMIGLLSFAVIAGKYGSFGYIAGGALVIGALWMIPYSYVSNYQRRQKFMQVGLLEPVATLSLLAATILSTYTSNVDLKSVVLFSITVSFFVASIFLGLSLKNRQKFGLNKEARKDFLRVIWVFWSSGSVLQLGARLDSFLVAGMTDMRTLAYYGAAARVAGPIGMLGAGVGTLLLPIARHAYECKSGLMQYVRRATFYSAVQFLFLVFLFMVSDQLIAVIFGGKYEGAGIILKWLLFARLLNASAVPLRVLMQVSDKPDRLLHVAMVRVIAGVVAIVIFVPFLGGSGAAIGMCVAEFIVLFLYVFILRSNWRFGIVRA